MSVISADNSIALATILVSAVAFGLAVEKTRFGKVVSGPLVILFGAMALSNIGVIWLKAQAQDGFSVLPVLILSNS